MNFLARYAHWLHLRWPAGTVEPLPVVDRDGSTGVPGLYVAGDLTGVPLLKLALESGARVARTVAAATDLRPPAPAPSGGAGGVADLVIVGAGVAGLSAAVEARRLGLRYVVLEATVPLATLVDFPTRKPIFTYPTDFVPESTLQVEADVKERLVEELRTQVERAGIVVTPGRVERIERIGSGLRVHVVDAAPIDARHVLVAVGRSGEFRRLGVPGEALDQVTHRLHDPRDHAGRDALVVGGGDTAIETAVALAQAGARVTLVHRGDGFPRARPENVAALERLRRDPGRRVEIERPADPLATTATGAFVPAGAPRAPIEVMLRTRVRSIGEHEVVLDRDGAPATVRNDVVFVMIGRQAPLGLLRRSGIRVAGDRTAASWAGFAAFLLFCAWLYDWKSGGRFAELWSRRAWFPTNLPALLAAWGGSVAAAARDPATLLGTLAISASQPSFLYTLAYSIVVVVFGVRRIRRRRTPYVTAQTVTLALVQVVPLFLLPEIVLPLLDHRGLLPVGLADALFPRCDYGHGREFWRAYGLVLAWPLDVYNVFTHAPLVPWLVISFVQTCVLIPLIVWRWGKGAYCGWICSCGALAETLGDTQRRKMPHGPGWNRLDLAGQVVLLVAVLLLAVRIAGWVLPPGNAAAGLFESVLEQRYKWTIDVFLAGVVGYGAYFWFSGRVWCRFFCPLAAWMHVLARGSRFLIAADKPRCISCGLCTAHCHQGIDVMSFANKGLPMVDPQCVRCSACVEVCPTGVLSFGRRRADGFVALDALRASPVQAREARPS